MLHFHFFIAWKVVTVFSRQYSFWINSQNVKTARRIPCISMVLLWTLDETRYEIRKETNWIYFRAFLFLFHSMKLTGMLRLTKLFLLQSRYIFTTLAILSFYHIEKRVLFRFKSMQKDAIWVWIDVKDIIRWWFRTCVNYSIKTMPFEMNW